MYLTIYSVFLTCQKPLLKGTLSLTPVGGVHLSRRDLNLCDKNKDKNRKDLGVLD